MWHRSEPPDAAFRRNFEESLQNGETADLANCASGWSLIKRAEAGPDVVLIRDDPVFLSEEYPEEGLQLLPETYVFGRCRHAPR